MDINQAFKVYDIRGKYPEVVDERLAFALGRALSDWKKPKKVLVCCDTRESSPSLKEFLIDGFGNAAVTVCNLGEAPLPMFNFAMTLDDYDLGVMVTASHISEGDNGFKMALPGPLPLDEKEVLEVKELTTLHQDEPVVVPKVTVTNVSASEQYIQKVLELVGYDKPKAKIAVDATRSAVLTTVMVIFQKLQVDFHLVDSKHGGNPLLATDRQALATDVVNTEADLGMMWDSDGDRVVFVNRRGELIPLSFILGMFGAAAVKNSPHKKVAVDIRAGLVVRDMVEQAGGKVVIVPAWNTNIKFAIKQDSEIAFGGETTGHFIFPDFYAIDDGILAALKFLRLFDQELVESQLAELGKKYFELPEKNIPCSAEKSVAALAKLTEFYRQQNCKISLEDGLTVYGPDFKFNLRESVTEQLLRLNLEATNKKAADEILDQIQKHLEV